MLSPACSISIRDNIQVLHIDNAFASAQVALFGAHMLSFQPKSDLRERFWLSKAAKLDGVQAIRGGVPLCWPWFGDHQIKQIEPDNKDFPSHGYVRTQLWNIVKTLDTPKGTEVTLSPTTTQGAGFKGEAQLQLIITIGQHCSMQLVTSNVGSAHFEYRCALHSYFAISDIRTISLQGITGDYRDKTQDMQTFKTPSPYEFNAETDRVHLCQASNVTIVDKQLHTVIGSNGHDSLVVWNPWQDKSISMNDMEDEGYLTMVCVETAITQGEILAPGQSHVLTQIVY
ncbi:MAG: D-hexose-6-phosphate mutarotase [Paraglaciecola sp.]|nr:D-hexose-6-phosphate mutarotase [Paraglaciecola sp.]MDP5129867.1 D-hexose-6-phosphate mutarotase [Paraglaciecola sp.]